MGIIQDMQKILVLILWLALIFLPVYFIILFYINYLLKFLFLAMIDSAKSQDSKGIEYFVADVAELQKIDEFGILNKTVLCI